jgi:streptogramin lyase
MNMRLKGAASARRALSITAGTVAVVLLAAVAPAYASVTISEFSTPTSNSNPGGITLGPDGHIWFTQTFAISTGVGSLTPVRKGPPAFGTNYSSGVNYRLGNIATGPDGNLWFTVLGPTYDQVGKMSPTGTVFHRWTITGDVNNDVVPDIVAGPDGNLWFTENSVTGIGRITTSGVITQFGAGTCGLRVPAQPGAIAAGPDGNLWFTISNCAEVGRITTSGKVTTFDIPAKANDIAAGPDKKMWFTGPGIGNIDPATGIVAPIEYQIPATSIAPSACANDLWFTSTSGSGSVGQVSTSGGWSFYPVPTAGSNPDDITSAYDGSVWFTEPNGGTGQVGRAVDSASFFPCMMLEADFRFAFPFVNGSQGSPVGWMVLAPGRGGAADASGMKLFGFSRTGRPIPVPVGSFFTFRFNWAGTFPYDDPFHPAAAGQVRIPVKIAPVVGAVGLANVTWASGDAPAGYRFDVQVKAPGSRVWVTWRSGATTLSAQFGPRDRRWAGHGTYSFRARLRKLANGAASGYSPARSITL